MNMFKCRPMAAIGFCSLITILLSVMIGYVFECGVIAAAVGVILLIVTVISKKLREVTVLFYLSAALLFSGFQLIGNSRGDMDSAKALAGNDVSVVAQVTGESKVSPSKTTYILKTASINGRAFETGMRLNCVTSLNAYAGDEISFTANVHSIDEYDDSLKRYYMSEGIYLGATVHDADQCVEVVKDGSETILCKLQRLRDEIKNRIYSCLPNEYGGIAIAMLIGDDSGVTDETNEAFRDSGISHLFAVSGLHLSIWIIGIYNILDKIGLRRKVNSLISIFFVFILMAVTGFTPSITRAGIMLIVMLTGNLVNRRSDGLNSLGFALIVILIVNPMAAMSASLLLSFLATLGIIVLYPSVEIFIEKLNIIKITPLRKIIKGILSVLAISVVATLFTLPVNAFVFGKISIIGPVTNILVAYPSTLLMISAGITALLQPVGAVSNITALLCGLCARFIVFVSDKLSSLSFAVINTGNILFQLSLIFLLCAVLCCFIIFKNRLNRIKAIIAVVLSITVISASVHFIYNHNLTTVKVIDVDDGICLVVEKSGQKAVLGCGASDSYVLDEVITDVFDKKASLLLVPNSNLWNSSLAKDISSNINFENIFSGEAIDNVKSKVLTDFAVNPWQNASIEFHSDPNITYAYCVFEGSDILIVFDFDNAQLPKEHLDADVLICSYYLGDNQNLSGFGNIIVSSTKAVGEDMINRYSPQNNNIHSTFGEKDITLEFRSEQDVKIIYN